MPLCLHFVINHSITFRAKKSKRLTWLCSDRLRWFERVFRFSVQLIFMKGLLVCVKRLLQLVESRCYNNLSTYSILVLSLTFWLSWQLDRPSNTPYSDIYSIQLQFTQKNESVNIFLYLIKIDCAPWNTFHFFPENICPRGFGAKTC